MIVHPPSPRRTTSSSAVVFRSKISGSRGERVNTSFTGGHSYRNEPCRCRLRRYLRIQGRRSDVVPVYLPSQEFEVGGGCRDLRHTMVHVPRMPYTRRPAQLGPGATVLSWKPWPLHECTHARCTRLSSHGNANWTGRFVMQLLPRPIGRRAPFDAIGDGLHTALRHVRTPRGALIRRWGCADPWRP